jgi:hypothetical protein
MTNPITNLRRAQVARQIFMGAIDAAVRDLFVELKMNCGVSDAHIDLKAFQGAVADGVSDMLYDALYHLRQEASEAEDAQAANERRADVADYHSRVA